MSPLRCAILDDYQNVALASADWSPLAGRVEVVAFQDHLDDEAALVARLADVDVVVAMRERTAFGARLLAQLPRLKLLITSGMRNGSIDVAAAKARGVVVCGTASSSAPPVELTWALILGLARSLTVESTALRANGPWQSTVGLDLRGRTLGLLGVGKIGSNVAKIGSAFGMRVLGWSENLTAERAAAAGAELAESKGALFAASDVLSIHLVLSDRTRHIVGAPELSAMKADALLINTSRAGIVDTAALIDALESARIRGAGLDVFDAEPLPPDHPFRTLPNVLATPHLGYVTRANYATYFREAVEDIAAFLARAPVRALS